MRRFAIIAAIMLCPAAVFGQHETGACSRPAYGLLARLEGEWSMTGETLADRRMNPLTGSMRASRDSVSCEIHTRVATTLLGRPFSVVSILVSNSDGSVKRAFLDSGHGNMNLSSGVVRGDTAAFVTAWDSPGGTLLQRYTLHFISPDTIEESSHNSADEGRSWRRVWRATYTRRK